MMMEAVPAKIRLLGKCAIVRPIYKLAIIVKTIESRHDHLGIFLPK
jgi:hypothetical protein